jgi:hypothetical protein
MFGNAHRAAHAGHFVVGIPSFPARDAIIFRAELRDSCGDSTAATVL